MTVDDLRTLLLALPGDLPVLLRSTDLSQGVVMLGDLQRVTLDVSEGLKAVLLESEMPETLRPAPGSGPGDPEPCFLKDPSELKHLHLVRE